MDLGGVLLSICALSFVCLGSLALFAFIALKLAGRSLGGLLNHATGGDYLPGMEKRPSRPLNRPALRRDGSSFDDALRRQGGDADNTPQSPSDRRIPRSGRSSLFNRDANQSSDLGGLRGRSAGSRRRRDSYEIYDDEGDF